MDELWKARSSYTAPNFPHPEPLQAKFEDILKTVDQNKLTINLDWLSVSFHCASDAIPEPEADAKEFMHEVSDKITLKYTGKGTQHYKYIWEVYYTHEKLASLLSHTRNEMFIKKNIVKVDFQNHLLYSSELWSFYNLLVKSLGLQIKSVSRFDIAIDGANYLLVSCQS